MADHLPKHIFFACSRPLYNSRSPHPAQKTCYPAALTVVIATGKRPVPIPNPEAKPVSADGTALERVWESRTPPSLNVNCGPVRWTGPQSYLEDGLLVLYNWTMSVTAVIAGLGDRGFGVYGDYARQFPSELTIVGVADPDPSKIARARDAYGLTAQQCFTSAEDLFSEPLMADVAIIATQDRQHVPQGIQALERGYHLLVEKPISPDPDECRALAQKAHDVGRLVAVGHVLRYTPFYATIKELLDTGAIGDVCAVQAAEQVGYFHQAHSFVRGNWRSSSETSPMILAKCCHDFDIFVWLLDAQCTSVSSFGSLQHFRADRAPRDAGTRCLVDCPAHVKQDCPFDAEKIYITSSTTGVRALDERGVTGARAWPASIVSPDDISEDGIRHQLVHGPYGRCVYRCDNDVVDHQVVNMEFDNGATVSFEMSAFTPTVDRSIRIGGTRGEIRGNMEAHEITVSVYGEEPRIISTRDGDLSGHGGGDTRLMADFLAAVRSAQAEEVLSPEALRTGIDRSIQSHLIALAAEESRLRGGIPIACASA